jgi:hypothetical protein
MAPARRSCRSPVELSLLLAAALTLGACHLLLPLSSRSDDSPRDARPSEARDVASGCKLVEIVVGTGWVQKQPGWWSFLDVSQHLGVGMLQIDTPSHYALVADVVIHLDEFRDQAYGGAGLAVNVGPYGADLGVDLAADFCDLSVVAKKLIPGYCPGGCTATCCGVWDEAADIPAAYETSYQLRAEVDATQRRLTCTLTTPDASVLTLRSQPFHATSGGLALFTQYASADFKAVTLCQLP